MNAPKRAGTWYETRLVAWFRERLWNGVDRQPNRGTRDSGDIDGFPDVVTTGLPVAIILGAKNEKALDISTGLNEIEANKAKWLADHPEYGDVLGWQIFARKSPAGRNRPIGQHYAVCTAEQLELVLRLLTGGPR